MSQDKRCSSYYNSYRHGIVCHNCVVRKYFQEKYSVRTVFIGTLVEIHNIEEENILFCIVENDTEIDHDLFICKERDIMFVPENLWGPLRSVEQRKRLKIIQDIKLAEALGNVDVGHTVQVLGPDNKKICIGNVTFRNSIAKLGVGIYFGLKITCQKDDHMTIIKKCSLLQPGTKGFPRGCDIVVCVDKIHPINIRQDTFNVASGIEHRSSVECDPLLLNVSTATQDELFNQSKFSFHMDKNTCEIPSSQYKSKYNANISDIPLCIGEKVVYLSDKKPEKGTVRWLGYINNLIKVGVEFDNQIGSGTGTVNGVPLFKAKYAHAAFMPPESLMKLSDFEMNNLKDYNNQQKAANNNNNYNGLQTNVQSCNLRHNMDDKNNILKINSFQNSKCTSFHSGNGFDIKYCENQLNKELGSSETYKFECSLISPTYSTSRSFDSSKSKEKKIGNNRWSKSMENDISENNELANLQNSFSSIQKSPNRQSNDYYGYNWTDHCELHGEFELYHSTKDFDKNEICENLLSMKKKSPQNKDICDPHNSEQSSSDESGEYYDTPKGILDNSSSEKLGKGSVVELTYKGQPHYGVIKWKGLIRLDGELQLPCMVAGVEMETERDDFSDGTFCNKRYFHCNPRKALFVPLSECRKDSRFSDYIRHNDSMKINSFGQLECPAVEGTLPPINRGEDLEAMCGKNRGIQGHHNSCYLDATLFSMFAFTSVFDSLLYRPPTVNDIPQYSEVQRVLKEEIVNPLRKNLYVRADRVMKLRTLLENLSSVSGLTCDEKDPEEFLNSLLAQILKAEPFLKLSSGQEAFHYQLFVEKDERLTFPSVQQLFEQSFVTSDIKLKQIPSCLIIQMPRFGKSFKMYSRIFPPQLLDVTDIIENSPRQCTVCGKVAEFECKDCFGQTGVGSGLESISFCKICLETAHNHHCRIRHNYKAITVPFEFFDLQEHCSIPRIFMELFAVVCIETSHYVAFVKCGSGSDAPWCFFDSMADRKGEQNGYNIPEMVACPDLPYWLSEEGAKTLNEMKDERQLPEHAKRLLCDAYMCMYQSPEIMMYR